MSEITVRGDGLEALTKLPTRYGNVPTTPFEGLVTVQKDKFWLALTQLSLRLRQARFCRHQLVHGSLILEITDDFLIKQSFLILLGQC